MGPSAFPRAGRQTPELPLYSPACSCRTSSNPRGYAPGRTVGAGGTRLAHSAASTFGGMGSSGVTVNCCALSVVITPVERVA